MHPENRKSPRIPKKLSAAAERVATVLVDGQNRIVQVSITDVSREGIGFISPEPFDKSAFVRLMIEMSPYENPAATSRRFVTSISVKNCTPTEGGEFNVSAEFRVGALIKEQTGREWEAWNELIRRWSQKVM